MHKPKHFISTLREQFTYSTVLIILKNMVQMVNLLHLDVQLKINFEKKKLHIYN